MAREEDKCIFCDKTVTEKNSPSETSRIGDYKICDPCLERIAGDYKGSNSDDDDDDDD